MPAHECFDARWFPARQLVQQPADRRLIADHVMAILEDEDFFCERYADSFDADQGRADSDDE